MADDGMLLVMKKGDTSPDFRAQCRDGKDANGVPIGKNLTGAASVKLLVHKPVVLDKPLTIENQVSNPGWVNCQWVVGDTDLSGTFDVEIEVTWAGGSKQTFPPNGYGLLVIEDDLG